MYAIIGAELFKPFVKGLNVLVSEARIEIRAEASEKESGLRVIAVDPANIAMVIAELPENVFEAIDLGVNVGGEKEIGVDVKRLLDITKAAKKNDLIELEATDSKFVVKIGRINYEFNLIDPAALRKPPKEPNIDLNAKVVMSPNEFERAVKLIDKISDYAEFVANEDGFVVQADGELESIKVGFPPHELIEFEGRAKARYSVEYLKQFVNAGKSADILRIEFGDDYPARLTFEFGDAKLSYILAPRIETE